jgi:hypothetical protein
MTPERKELFRTAILRVMDANNTRWGLSIVAIGHHLGPYGFSVSSFESAEKFYEAIADELQYLEDKKLIEKVLKIVSKENQAWRISRAGIAFVDGYP